MADVKEMLEQLYTELRKGKNYSAADKLLPIIEEAEKWVSCSDRLPNEEGKYLVTIEFGTDKRRMVKKATLKVFANGKKKWLRVGKKDNVIAWMELPEPYKGE